MRRIVVVGTSGSGKSTLAVQVSKLFGIPRTELDALYWGPNWTPRERSIFTAAVVEAISQDAWVIDGGYSTVRPLIWDRADTIIWLDYPFRVVFLRVLLRTLKRGITGQLLWNNNRERLWVQFFDKESILLWVINTWRVRRRDYPALLREQKALGKRVIRFRHPTQTQRWCDAQAN